MAMQRANESQPDDHRILDGTESSRAALWPSDLPNSDAHRRDPATRIFFRNISLARHWIAGLAQRVFPSRQTKMITDNDIPSTLGESFGEMPQLTPIEISAADVKRRMDGGDRFVFVDARTIDEWIESPGRIAGSVRMAVSEVRDRLKALPRNRTIVTYSAWPDEESSTLVATELARLGLVDVHPMNGGLHAWRAAGGPIERV